jgi:hypothetical protein
LEKTTDILLNCQNQPKKKMLDIENLNYNMELILSRIVTTKITFNNRANVLPKEMTQKSFIKKEFENFMS